MYDGVLVSRCRAWLLQFVCFGLVVQGVERNELFDGHTENETTD